MNRRYPKITIIEHDQEDVKRLLRVPFLKDIKLKSPDSITVVLKNRLEDIPKVIFEKKVDIIISDVFFPTDGGNVERWSEVLGQKFAELDIPIVLYSSHLTQKAIITLVNRHKIAAIITKSDNPKDIDLLLKRLTTSRYRKTIDSFAKRAVTWLCISDLHFTELNNHDRNKIQNSFFEDIKRLMDYDVVFDMVMVTGDITYSGSENEYNRAYDFLNKLLVDTNIPKDHIFIVPGNHDLDRKMISPTAHKILPQSGRDEVRKVFDDTSAMALLVNPFQAYRNFVHQIQSNSIIYTQDEICFSHVFNHDGISIGIAGVNSSLFSNLIRDSNGIFYDKGNLLIDEAQIDEVLDNIRNADLRILLMHHPLSYLKDFSIRDLLLPLQEKCDILLHGHLHISDFERINLIKGEIIQIPVGSLFQRRDLLNSYSISSWNKDERVINVNYRKYSDVQQAFIKDLDTTGENLDGEFQFFI